MQQAFDTYAKSYDEHFTYTPIGRMQRNRVHYFLKNYLKVPQTILELNCGTGEDAIYFLNANHNYFGTDISESMINEAKRKNKNFDSNFITLNALDIDKINANNFSMIFSNFGGLNCLNENELKSISSKLHSITQKNALLAFVIMGNGCIWENFYFKKIKSKLYNRRKTIDGVTANINGNKFKTYYYTPKEIQQMFSNEFNFVTSKPIGLFVPPSYLNYFFKSRLFLLNCLYFLETLFGNFSKLSNKADHYLIILQKKDN